MSSTSDTLKKDPDLPKDAERPIDARCYDYPVMVSPIRDTGWNVVNIVEREVCPTLSANRRWNAHDFSLIGRDVAKGETVVCRAWMIYAELKSNDEAMDLAAKLTEDVEQNNGQLSSESGLSDEVSS